jgi:hypothetical protein
MKECIVLVASIALGVFIYGLIAGADDGSMMSVMSEVWQDGLTARDCFGK